MAALVHRMNGALNNASMALEIALADPAAADEATLRAAIAAMARASRAAVLLAYLVHGQGAPGDPDGSYARDVEEILGEHSRATGGALPAPGHAQPGDGAAQAADRLVAELSRLRTPQV